jgi:hypothetical protein
MAATAMMSCGLVPSTTVTTTHKGGPGADKLRFEPGCLAVNDGGWLA